MTDTAQDRTQATYLQKDLDQIAGTPDGELVFIDLIGFEVPSFIDPRYDLIQAGQVGRIKRLNHHVPFSMRGDFFIAQLPDPELWDHEVDEEKYCVCQGKTKAGLPCRKRAQNRSQFCGLHGGALHPADRKLSNLPDGIVPEPNKIAKMTRAQKVAGGMIPVSELGDDEIRGMYVWDDDGRKVSSRKINTKIYQDMTHELMIRMQDRLIEGVDAAVTTMYDIMTDDMVEAGDRFKAAQWWTDRVLGKTPDILITGKMDTPHEQILGRVQTTSREEYRRALAGEGFIEGEIVPDGDLGQDRDSAWNSDQREPRARSGMQMPESNESSDSGDAVHFEDVVMDPVPVTTETAPTENRYEKLNRKARLQAERKRQQNRRFVARLLGEKNTTDLPWRVEYKPFGKSGHAYAKLHAPDDQNEELLARLASAEALLQTPSARP